MKDESLEGGEEEDEEEEEEKEEKEENRANDNWLACTCLMRPLHALGYLELSLHFGAFQ